MQQKHQESSIASKIFQSRSKVLLSKIILLIKKTFLVPSSRVMNHFILVKSSQIKVLKRLKWLKITQSSNKTSLEIFWCQLRETMMYHQMTKI